MALLTATFAAAQMAVTATAPPGTTAANFATAVGWARWLFGGFAVALVIWACIRMKSHAGEAWGEIILAVICIVVASNAQGVVTALYGAGNG